MAKNYNHQQQHHQYSNANIDEEEVVDEEQQAGEDGIYEETTNNNNHPSNGVMVVGGHSDLALVESSASSFDASTRTLIEFFVSTGQALSVFDNFRLRAFLAELNPSYVLPSSSSVEFDYLPEIAATMVDDLRHMMTSVEHVAITTNTFRLPTSENREFTGMIDYKYNKIK